MYCRNCKNQLGEDAAICMQCGVPVGKGKNYCPVCGEQTHPEAVMCVKCGSSFIKEEAPAEPVGAKSAMVAGILGIFLGALGVHNFYLGYTKKAVVQLLLSIFSIFFAMLYVAGIVGFTFEWEIGALIFAVISLIIGVLCSIAVGIWAFVEAIMLLCGAKKKDGKGNLLKKAF